MLFEYCAAVKLAKQLNYEYDVPVITISGQTLPIDYKSTNNTVLTECNYRCITIHSITLPQDVKNKNYMIELFGFFFKRLKILMIMN